MGLFAFGRHRRDETAVAPAAALVASGTGMTSATRVGMPAPALLVADAESVATAVRAAALGTPGVAGQGPGDSDVPRWRRQSLIEARKADPTRSASVAVGARFAGLAGEAVSGLERRQIRYRLVSLLDRPDDVLGAVIGSLDEGDEVVPFERRGAYWRVLCPDGSEGWLHRMVLGPAIAGASPDGSGADAPPAPGPMAAPGSFEDVLRLYTDRRQAVGSFGV